MTMVGMLGVLLLLIVRSGDPNTWSWLANDDGANQPRSSPALADDQNNENVKNDDKDTGKDALKPSGANKTGKSSTSVAAGEAKEPLPASGGPTDLDPEEVEAIQEEFQAVTDGKYPFGPRKCRPTTGCCNGFRTKRCPKCGAARKKTSLFTQFYQSPDKYRGQLFELKLNVRRILKYTHNDLTLYEVWGWTAESRSWPYVGVVSICPRECRLGRMYMRRSLW